VECSAVECSGVECSAVQWSAVQWSGVVCRPFLAVAVVVAVLRTQNSESELQDFQARLE
jgi:hypothetical protein